MTMQSPLAVAIVPPVTTPGVTQETPVAVSVVSGGGISQLTGGVTAGPGSGAQVATVQALDLGTPIPLTTALQLGASAGTYANFAFFRAKQDADIIASNLSATGHTGVIATKDADGSVLVGSDSAGAKRAQYVFVANAVRVHSGNLNAVASAGQFNGTSGGALCFRNQANNADVFAIQKDTSDRVIVGDNANAAEAWQSVKTGGVARFLVNNATRVLMSEENAGGVITIDNATAAPAAPAIGALLYSIGGALHGKGTGGTDTLLAPAEVPGFEASDGHCPECGKDFAFHASNPKMGMVTICMWCLSELLGDRPWIVRRAP